MTPHNPTQIGPSLVSTPPTSAPEPDLPPARIVRLSSPAGPATIVLTLKHGVYFITGATGSLRLSDVTAFGDTDVALDRCARNLGYTPVPESISPTHVPASKILKYQESLPSWSAKAAPAQASQDTGESPWPPRGADQAISPQDRGQRKRSKGSRLRGRLTGAQDRKDS